MQDFGESAGANQTKVAAYWFHSELTWQMASVHTALSSTMPAYYSVGTP